ncbi:transcriptional regulator, BadM/Rrf2 family [Solidesulfovibrio carbinoliphilus subsp. oakridgensis]|uniref:Transcriptional regulator, BadM/Rrf2 family n=1 Tax=Solidesulfovibrio carbinoliphilus subsp. oakridgensis TaxID=694327 RepID=G7QDB3_9BACT|nr:Rrf2 family transcriptional regulator [Solidesulfovibrio carbinoliphilus]EHJ46419.1 transcriptional regulator, BadM/Rrf2 family [Solidesulfovibrio carbinoliphilus subsp. oakridgensis]
MRLTRAGEYAIRCVLHLSMHRDRPVITRKEIAEAMDIPAQFLGKVAQHLARAGIIAIRQGAQGGYELVRRPEDITLLSLVEAIDGEIFLNDCISRPESCDRRKLCSVHRVWDKARSQLRETLGSTTLAALAETESKACAKRPDGP